MKRLVPSLLGCFLMLSPARGLAQDTSLDLYGFFTFEWETDDIPGTSSTFDLHRFNVITEFRWSDRYRVFGEIEWEHGISLEAGGLGSGSVALERAWFEYSNSDALRVKAGRFITPFGLYNLRHDAAATYLFVFLPSSVYGKHDNTVGGTQRLYAKFATGVQALGTVFVERWLGRYYAYVSNGRGPKPGEQDNNANKGVGGRINLTSPEETFSVGLSYYTDRNGNAGDTRQRSVGVDATFDYRLLHLEGEFIYPRLEMVDTVGAPNGKFRDGIGYYLQGSYSLVGSIRPFARYGSFNPDLDVGNDRKTNVVLGLNISLDPRVYLKNEVHFRWFQNPALSNQKLYVASLAVAF
ncbi:MAG: porin [Gemmatimonadetes bacterium]|nr:porin [Gemmatimonadota bacterium]